MEFAATGTTLGQVRQITLKVFVKYAADMARICISHFPWIGKGFAASGGCLSSIKAHLPLCLRKSLEDVGAENDSDRKEEVEIFVYDPNIGEADADE